ncbi:hypothetical protein [Oceanobacillus salinisoli]|uniref:hypothetical protein n=1 Tax=Oceanobacillus salinisoli TaxID=2678611 RepID=UPI0012E25133|nr:hypothetical protein [Oceanobacillus salinisoli]
MHDDKKKRKQTKERFTKIKSYQEINNEISNNKDLKERQPTLDPQDFEEIEY